HHITLLPEIHASYEEKIYEKISDQGYMVYDFFLPGLILHALEKHDGSLLSGWAREQREKNILTVNMLGCHDGIPLLDLKGLLDEDQIQDLINTVVGRGGYIKNLHGQENVYYQINATYYSALGEDDRKMLLARALQLFMPGKPQIWYLDLFAGKNDYAAIQRAGSGGHKEINRTNLSLEEARAALDRPVVRDQLKLLRMRCQCPAFSADALFSAAAYGSQLSFCWQGQGQTAALDADLDTYSFTVTVTGSDAKELFHFSQ
ncbi:MAG: glycosidase, partial [Lachnospiraceae bacterium]|nr:glycosidase [Lachnospiraceae bacterium]